MDNSYNVLLHLHDKSNEATAFAHELEAFICDLKFHRQETDFNVRNWPLLVVVKKSSNLHEVLREIDEDITKQSHEGVVIIVYFWTRPSERIANIKHDFKYIIGMDFKDGTLSNVLGRAKPKNDQARKEIRSACAFRRRGRTYYELPRESVYRTSKEEKKVLLYQIEKEGISSEFTRALKKFTTKHQFHPFDDATEEKEKSRPIVVVVRSTTVRYNDDLDSAAAHLKSKGISTNRVIVVYFQKNPVDRSTKQIASNAKGNNFWEIIDMDFSGSSFYRFRICGIPFFTKSINARARDRIQLACESLLNQKGFVGVYYIETSKSADRFLDDVRKYVHPQILLRPSQPIDKLTQANSATVVYTTLRSDSNEKDPFPDSRKVVFFRILEAGSDNCNDDEQSLHPESDVQTFQKFINWTEKQDSMFGLSFTILLGNGREGRENICSLKMLEDFKTFIYKFIEFIKQY